MLELKDELGRHLTYVRISITDRCNFRCSYCMPEKGVQWLDHSQIMRFEDIMLLCEVLIQLGVKKIRFTGGEPLVRRGFITFLQAFREKFPDIHIALTTNASLLQLYITGLKEVHLSGLNISLDTLDPYKFQQITRTGNIHEVIAGISRSAEEKLADIKINAVLIKGFNDDEVETLLDFSAKMGAVLRLIEFMPIEEGVWSSDKFISTAEILELVSRFGVWEKELPLDSDKCLGPAVYYRDRMSCRRIGLISAVSEHFCSSCNRLRVSSVGKLRTCLFSNREYSLIEDLRRGDVESIKNKILTAVCKKPEGWRSIRDGSLHMSSIGG